MKLEVFVATFVFLLPAVRSHDDDDDSIGAKDEWTNKNQISFRINWTGVKHSNKSTTKEDPKLDDKIQGSCVRYKREWAEGRRTRVLDRRKT